MPILVTCLSGTTLTRVINYDCSLLVNTEKFVLFSLSKVRLVKSKFTIISFVQLKGTHSRIQFNWVVFYKLKSQSLPNLWFRTTLLISKLPWGAFYAVSFLNILWKYKATKFYIHSLQDFLIWWSLLNKSSWSHLCSFAAVWLDWVIFENSCEQFF